MAGGAQGGGDFRPGANEANGGVVKQEPPPHLLRQCVRLVVVPAVRHHAPKPRDPCAASEKLAISQDWKTEDSAPAIRNSLPEGWKHQQALYCRALGTLTTHMKGLRQTCATHSCKWLPFPEASSEVLKTQTAGHMQVARMKPAGVKGRKSSRKHVQIEPEEFQEQWNRRPSPEAVHRARGGAGAEGEHPADIHLRAKCRDCAGYCINRRLRLTQPRSSTHSAATTPV